MSLWFPVLAQVTLTFGLLFFLAYLRVASIARGEIKIRDIALGQPHWTTRATQVGNCFRNQFETPVLFYLLVVLCEVNHLASPVITGGAWLYVLTRYGHAAIEVTQNHVPRRFQVFLIGSVTLLGLWGFVAAKFIFRD